MVNLLYLADHLGASKAVPFTRKVYENQGDAAEELSLFFHSMRKTKNEPAPASNLHLSRATSKFDPRTVLEIRRSIRRWNIDVVHAMSIRAIVSAVLVKRVFEPDLHVVVRLAGRIYRGDRWFEITLRGIHSSVDRFIAPSEPSKAKFVEVGINPDKIEKQYNFLNLDRFDPTRYDPSRERGRLDVSGDPIICYVGRLIELKNVEAMLRGFEGLRETYPDSTLLLVGEGDKRASYEQLADALGIVDHVTFLGFREDIPAIISACDAGVLVSEYESFGMPIIEFLAMERSVVATDVGIASEVDGVVDIEQSDAAAIKAGMAEALRSDPGAGDRVWLEPFTSDAYFDRIQALCKELSPA